jgi:hypothetical protein
LKNFLIVSLFFLVSCSTFLKRNTEQVLARVHDDYLFESDLAGVIPRGTPPGDSLVLLRNFIDNWIRQRLLLHQAQKNLTGEEMDFSRQLENYQNSLIIFQYETAIVNQKLDTLVTDDELQAYYEANQQNFLLKDNIVQIQYVKLPLKSENVRQIRKLLNSDDLADKSKLSEICEKEAADYFLDDQNWLKFNDLLQEIPVKAYNQEDFLRNHRQLDYQDSMFIYLVRFKDFKIKETVSPLSFEKEKIREIILNKRKIELIGRMQEDVYNNAQNSSDFEIY